MPAWHPHPDVWLLLGAVWAAYLVAVRAHAATAPVVVRTHAATAAVADRGERRRRTILFTAGMALLFLVSDWPVHDLAEGYLYSAHMVQHMVYTLVAAPLLVAGIPAWMWRALLRPRPIGSLFRTATRPVVALVLFNAVLLFTHWPEIVEASVGSEAIHFALHVLVVGSGIVMWWPVLSPLPERAALSPPGQMLYLFFQSLAPTIPASFLTFGQALLYPVYGTFPRIWGMSALTDQLVAGLIMKIVGGLILWGFIVAIFFEWHARERDGWDALALRQVERDVRAATTK